MIKNKPLIVVLTGSGISAESGIKTFRDPGGLWEKHKPEELATPEAFKTNPDLVHRFYNSRRAQLASVEPNVAHVALARLESVFKENFLLVTQNVDDLHKRAGSSNAIQMHGELKKVRCIQSKEVFDWDEPILVDTKCPCCNVTATLRPHIVWFGELPLQLDSIYSALKKCDLFISIGTSGVVYPASGFVDCLMPSAHSIEVNIEHSFIASSFKEHRIGLATACVPELVEELILKYADGRKS